MRKKGGVLTDECTTNCASSAAAAGLQSPKGARQSKGTVGMVSDACITIDASLLLFSRTGPPNDQVVAKKLKSCDGRTQASLSWFLYSS